MRAERAGRSAELAEDLDGGDARGDALQPVREHRELLADGGRGGGLAVGVREHRVGAVCLGTGGQRIDDGAEFRHPHVSNRRLHGEGVREVVDVLARAGEVGELGDLGEAELGELRAHEVLDRLDVVAGGGLEPRELVDLCLAEVGGERAERSLALVVELRRAEQLAVGEVEQPLHLDAHACAIEASLGEVVAERRHDGLVAAVERAERLRRHGGHRAPCRTPGMIWRNSATHACSIMPSTWSNIAASE